jgi:hypothetical protein
VTGSRAPWDDARLAAAFKARGATARSTPSDLADATIHALEHEPRPRRIVPHWLLAAATIVVAVSLAGGAILTLSPGRLTEPSSPGRGPTSPVLDAIGEPIDVRAALAVRGSGHPDREILVNGFLSPFLAVPCPFVPAPGNPADLRCPESFRWLMEEPERMTGTVPRGIGEPPTGPAFHPSFALVETKGLAPQGADTSAPTPVVVLGHFHDRRAARCEPPRQADCAATFVVDRVVAVNGAQFLPRTVRPEDAAPQDLEEDVDALVRTVAPDAVVESRQIVTMGGLFGIEPVLQDDPVVGAWGDPGDLVWLVTTVDLRDGIPVARTFALMDGTNWFAEVTADGAVMHDRQVPLGPSDGAEPIAPSADPAAFVDAPASVLGIPVRDIATLERDRRADGGDLGRDEFAIRAWYVGPRPGVECPAPAIHGVTPPCDEARHWLLDRPDQLGVEPGQLRVNPDHWPPVLNPLLPPDVPFDVPDTWAGDAVAPQPIVVLGHFEDHRVSTYAGNLWFVVDALAWTRDRAVPSLDTLVRLTTAASEDAASVLARIDRMAGRPAVATWTTVIDAAALGALDPATAADAPELTSGAPIWVVRRLVADEMDGRKRLAVQWAYTSDGGSRIWISPQPDAAADLATTIDLQVGGDHRSVIRVADYAQQITSVQALDGAGSLTWQRAGPAPEVGLDVARGPSDREVAIRWKGPSCADDWRVLVRTMSDGMILVAPQTEGGECSGPAATIGLVLSFDRPIDLDRIRTDDPCCG